MKNVILSQVKTFDLLFYKNYVFYQSQFITDNCFWWYLQHNSDSKLMDSQKIIVYSLKNSIKSLYIISWNVLQAFVSPFLVLTTSFTLGVNRANHWIDKWFIFVETGMSNTLSTAKFIWNFPLRRERRINSRKKNFRPHFLSLICVQTSVGVPFGYRKNLERIRRIRNVTIYDFRQVHLKPVKNAMLSPVKTFDWLFSRKYVFYQSQINTDNCFWG